METAAKKTIQCDSCKSTIIPPIKGKDGKTPPDDSLKALLQDGIGGTKEFHLCSEYCLRHLLNTRHNKAKASISTAFEYDISKTEAFSRYISTKNRNEMPNSDFIDHETRSFPIKNCEDIKAAIHAWGRYKGKLSFSEFKARITEKAHKLGCPLPDKWEK